MSSTDPSVTFSFRDATTVEFSLPPDFFDDPDTEYHSDPGFDDFLVDKPMGYQIGC